MPRLMKYHLIVPRHPCRVWRRQLGFTASSKFHFLTLVSFHCLVQAAEAKHLRWCDVQILDVSMPARYEKVSGIVNISETTGHAT